MLESDKLALRALLLSICNRTDPRAPSNIDAHTVVADVLCETQTVLSDFARSWNQKHTCCRLPAEILGMCLLYLPFKSRILASCTSQSWRAALAAPSVWADISEDRSGRQLTVQVLQMALSRSGAVPLSLEFGRELKGEMLQLVHGSMHRVVYLELYLNADKALLEQPAPLLRTLHVAGTARLTKDFLSGCSSRLVTLHAEQLHFAHSCLRLSSLTSLTTNRFSGATLQAIFDMCPRLQTLYLRKISTRAADLLGSPPPSLVDLTLGTDENDADLLGIYEAYRRSPSLKRVILRYGCDAYGSDLCDTPGCDANALEIALHGVVDLRLYCHFPQLSISASYPASPYLSLHLKHMFPRDWLSGYAPIFQQRAECFANLRTLSMPIFALEALAAAAPPMPALVETTLEVFKEIVVMDGYCLRHDEAGYPWHLLRFLRAIAQRRVVLHVEPDMTGNGPPECPTKDDARALMAELAKLEGPFEIRVTGFPSNCIPAERSMRPGIDVEFV